MKSAIKTYALYGAIIAAALLVYTVAFAQSLQWQWQIPAEKTIGGWGSYYAETTVKATCDGTTRVYIARSIGTHSDPLAMAVVPGGCAHQPAEAR